MTAPPPQAVSIGRCGHSDVCASCCLRLRLCYKQQRCPLCKDTLKEVVIVRLEQSSSATFADLMAHKDTRLWHKKQWAPSVFVDTMAPGLQAEGGQRGRSKPLQVELMRMTARACVICDRGGAKPFPTNKALLNHVESSHNRHLCHVCLKVFSPPSSPVASRACPVRATSPSFPSPLSPSFPYVSA